ncbi:YhcN/YlaJ family sporulation lipoprotein [Salipaludibacillus sp. HK11]|uniref:YhcN/YlaJ family sporulation lipoprotein n=1 Tax=Salipaludibacillus sp. HK11 TaxID=3394320 RepID=UPI0039FC56A2
MKKIALGLSVATILLSGVACGDMNGDTTEGQGTAYQRDQTGYGVDRADGTGAGQQGMMGRETERFGQRTGIGQNRMTEQGARGAQRGTQGFGQGIVGNDRPGMVDENGLLNGDLDGLRNRNQGNVQRGTQDRMNGGNQQGQQGMRGQGSQGQGREEQGYFNTEDGKTARNIEKRVENMDGVNGADVIVHDDNVIVAVDASGNNQKIEENIRGLAKGKQVHVVTDKEGRENIQGMGNQLRGGAPFEEVGSTFNAMLDDLGDAIQRPFERSR